MPEDVILEVQQLKKYFPIRGGVLSRVTAHVQAVDGVSFSIGKGKTFGLVGESGCGKTTVGRMLSGLLRPSEGSIIFDGRKIENIRRDGLRELHRRVQIIFQDPAASLNPYMTVEQLVAEPLEIYRLGNRAWRRKRVGELMDMVGLPSYCRERRTGDFSSGQQQRVAIARALALEPELVVADEPVSVLDTSAQAQILNLLSELQKTIGVSYLFISHALNVIEYISDQVGVMYLGKMVEIAPCKAIYRKQLHPYTRALFSAIPHYDPDELRERIVLQGEVPSPVNPPTGCRFHTRCWEAVERCSCEEPGLRAVGNGHFVACHQVN